jgi:dipeptidyl aminopeptidase/acylaminoacyl peptidase
MGTKSEVMQQDPSGAAPSSTVAVAKTDTEQQQKCSGFTLEDGLKLSEFIHRVPIDISADGRFLAYTLQNLREQQTVSGGHADNGTPRPLVSSALWISDIEHGTSRRLVPEKAASWGGRWSPGAAERLAFFCDRDGDPHLFVWERDTDTLMSFPHDTVRTLFEFEVALWSPNGRHILFKALPLHHQQQAPDLSASTLAAGGENELVQIWESPKARSTSSTARQNDRRSDTAPGTAPLQGPPVFLEPTDVAMADVQTGAVHRLFGGVSVRHLALSPDGSHLAVVGNVRFEYAAGGQPLFDLYLVAVPQAMPETVPEPLQQPVPLLRGLALGYGINLSWSPDGRHLAFTTSDTGDVIVVDVRDGFQRCLTQYEQHVQQHDEPQKRVLVDGVPLPHIGNDYDPPLWSHDGARLICISAGNLWALPLHRGGDDVAASTEPRNLMKGLEVEVRTALAYSGSTGIRAGGVAADDAFLVRTFDVQKNRSGLWRVQLNAAGTLVEAEGKTKPGASPLQVQLLLEEDRRYAADRFGIAIASKSGVVVFQAEDEVTPADLWLLESSTEGAPQQPRQVTQINPHLMGIRFTRPELIVWNRSEDDESESGSSARGGSSAQGEGKGLLLLPPLDEGQPDKVVPLVVWVYAGQEPTRLRHRFGLVSFPSTDHPEFFVSHGFGVLLPDIVLETNDPREEIARRVLPGIDAAIATGRVDAERIGVIGHSYGGYNVVSLITQTDRFRAAVSCAPIGNLISFYLEGEPGDHGWTWWAETGQGRMGGSLWEQRERYIANSPLFFLDRVQTPLLLIYGEHDRANRRQAEELYRAMTRLDKEVILARYHQGDHHWASWSTEQIRDFWDRVLSWFDTYLAHTPNSGGCS